MALPVLMPDWPAPAGVHALCTTRIGGVSLPPYDQLNLGDHVGDDPDAVAANRARLHAHLQAVTPGAHPVFLRQVHGTQVLALDAGMPASGYRDAPEADACVASTPGAVCTIMVADCLPVLLAHRSAPVVAAAHAGWRGLAGASGHGVLESVFERFSAQVLMDKAQGAPDLVAIDPMARRRVAADTLAWLGPCIGPRAFEVGAEVVHAFSALDEATRAAFQPKAEPGTRPKFLANLSMLARQRLQALGINNIYGNDGHDDWCTVAQASRFFSHRRDTAVRGGSGRFAACIWLGDHRP